MGSHSSQYIHDTDRRGYSGVILNKSIVQKEQQCKLMIGKKVIDKRMPGREGILKYIDFHSKDYSVCWFKFEWERGGYLLPIRDVEVIWPMPVQMRLFE